MNIIVIPYRDQYFYQRYGCIVRDLMIIKTLAESERVKRLVVVNRPVTVYEKFLTKFSRRDVLFGEKTKIWDQLDFDLLGPLKKRAWTETCYRKYLQSIVEYAEFPDLEYNVLLDFTPIAKIEYSVFPGFSIWYDVIDNFTRHNAYSEHEKILVREKYNLVNKSADLVTGVTREALQCFENARAYPVANGMLSKNNGLLQGKDTFDCGFLGFLTDKFDISFVQRLSDRGYSIAIYGQSYNSSVSRALASIENVTLFGKFIDNEVPAIMASFAIGLIPYLPEKSHDESPLKLYQYLDYGKPVIMSQPFDGYAKSTDFVHIYRDGQLSETVHFIEQMQQFRNSDPAAYVTAVRQEISDEVLWNNKVDMILDVLLNQLG